jgi:hypothetical protein
MVRPFPDKETLDKVIEERMQDFDQQIITGFLYEDGAGTFYVDKKGLVHKSGPHGPIVSFVGWTNQQFKESQDPDSFAPMPR